MRLRRSAIWTTAFSAMAWDGGPAAFVLHAYILRPLLVTDAQQTRLWKAVEGNCKAGLVKAAMSGGARPHSLRLANTGPWGLGAVRVCAFAQGYVLGGSALLVDGPGEGQAQLAMAV